MAAVEAEDEEVDIEGVSEHEQWFDFKSSEVEEHKNDIQRKQFLNPGILHPVNTPFSSEYCDPSSWLLDGESVWSLDHCADEKSRATIEKMILEEEMYLQGLTRTKQGHVGQKKAHVKKGNPCNGKIVDQKARKTTVKLSRVCQGVSHRKPWSKEEQELFDEGLRLYGRSWTRISSLIPSRTSLQVKNYANQYFKNKNKLPDSEVSHVNSVDMADSLTSELDQGLTQTMFESEAFSQSVANNVTEDDDEDDDDDIEIDIDGPDCDDNMATVVLGQKLSPDEVYLALLKAATEDNDSDASLCNEESSENEDDDNDDNDDDDNKNIDDVQSNGTDQDQEGIEDRATHLGDDDNTPQLCHTEGDSPKERVTVQGLDEDIPVYTETVDIQSDDTRQPRTQIVYEHVSVFTPNNTSHASEDSQEELQNVTKLEEENSSQNSDYTDEMSVLNGSTTFYSLCEPTEGNAGSGNLENIEKSISLNPGNGLSNCSTVLDDAYDDVPVAEGPIISSCCSVTLSDQVPTNEREQPVAQLTESETDALYLNITRDTVLKEERTANAEFFMGRSPKTPERYVKIRNYILDMWDKTQPNYLYKTSLRAGLRNCGDVNSIGRVHSFLEDVGAINVDCLDRPPPRTRHRSETWDEQPDVPSELWVNSLRPRKRKVRSELGDWIDESETEGLTIEHLSPGEQVTEIKDQENTVSPSKRRLPRTRHLYNPFQLIPCRKFPSSTAVPFEVIFQSNTLVVMDTHAHMSTTEVIGLLGGRYCHDTQTLKISEATPCRSISTGMQCEMDPVSQTQASEHLAGRGFAVVGWYHSHPRFAASPSVRDIETQAKFQEWFAKGGSPFIGVIVSPYNQSNTSNQSQIRCLTVSNEWSIDGQHRVPYQFDYEVCESQATEEYRLDEIRMLAHMYRSYPFRVQLSKPNGQFSIIHKLLESISCHLRGQSEEKTHKYIQKVRDVLLEEPSVSPEQDQLCT